MNANSLLQPENSELGKKSDYSSTYNPDKLFPIAREKNRQSIGIDSNILPFYGFDLWNHYEVSWLNEKGKPVVALAEIIYRCDSLNIIESKSMKLYFNSFNNTQFKDAKIVQALIKADLEERLKGPPITVRIIPVSAVKRGKSVPRLRGICLDELDISCSVYHVDPSFLKTEDSGAIETLYSDLLKSNCLVTHQPDWCSIEISYAGKKINHEGLLRYIISFRNDNEFHEHCIEKIFMHIMQRCNPASLTIYGRSTRRGGLDINSCRSTGPIPEQMLSNTKLCRQ